MSKQLTRYEKSFKVKRRDRVLVTAGRSKGETGVVIRVDRANDRVYIKGVNLILSRKRKSQYSKKGTKVEMPVHISNVSHYVELDGKIVPSKVHYDILEGKKVRVLTKTGAVIQEYSYSKPVQSIAEEEIKEIKEDGSKEEAQKEETETLENKEEEKEQGEQE